jgi:hypothetical protein|tara:strand:- start:1751 stop:2206 length:456 start_codon:yes stop_codon:yes gene_type:complete
MATVDKTTGGTAGHPSTRRKPYYVENTIDNSLFDPASGDIIQSLNVPAETLVIAAGLEVLTASSSSVTMDLGITGSTAGHHDPDCWVDGYDATGTGLAPMDAVDAAAMLVVKTADTIDILTGGAQDTAGKVRVWAVLCDVSGSDETASNSS